MGRIALPLRDDAPGTQLPLRKDPPMRRATLFAAAALLAVPGVGWLLSHPPSSTARPAQAGEKAQEGPRSTALGIGRAVLYSSGVGYFQREGTVEGDARVDLAFPVADVND